MQTGVRGRLLWKQNSLWIPFSWHHTDKGRVQNGTILWSGGSGAHKYCSFKGFVAKICLLQWSQWDCSASHQMTIWLKIRMRVWSRVCYLLNLFFSKECEIPKGSVVLQRFHICEAWAFCGQSFKTLKRLERNRAQCFVAANILLHAIVSLVLTAEEKLMTTDNEVKDVFHRNHFNFSAFLLIHVLKTRSTPWFPCDRQEGTVGEASLTWVQAEIKTAICANAGLEHLSLQLSWL